MENPSEQQIRQRAHQLWEQHERPEGRDAEFWHLAEIELHGTQEREPAAPGSPEPMVE
jgi:hypothetical protein